MRITADRTACLGAGQCVRLAPTLFDQDETEGLVVILDPDPAPADHPAAHQAASACPNRVITIDPT